jgi:acyl-CoA dehydrogenase
MAWDFETEPEFQEKLDWVDEFLREEVEPLSYLGMAARSREITKPLKDKVKAQGLWACHLGPELGGQGYGQVKLALLNEKLGQVAMAPSIFGAQAPDSGNAEILAHFGTKEQKEKWLWPLLNGDIRSGYSMSEPHGGSDPLGFKTRADLDSKTNEWVINGEKWFTSGGVYADILIVYAGTDFDHPDPYKRMSMFVVPRNQPGVELFRDIGGHAYFKYNNVRIPYDYILGGRGDAFVIGQTRLGGGRVHHAMRTVGACAKALDLMCQRAVSRTTREGKLMDYQMVQEQIADSWIQLEQFRLQVLHCAWKIDKYKDYTKVRKDIAGVKVAMPKVYQDIAAKALHLHGAIGTTDEMPFKGMVNAAFVMGIADGPTEVHKVTVAKQVLKDYKPDNDLFPAYHLPKKREAAQNKYGPILDKIRKEYEARGQAAPGARGARRPGQPAAS